MNVFYKIGEFAALCGTAKSTLNYYAKIDLMKPHHIGENGYYYYAPSQLYEYELIFSLREMDVSLEDIRNYLNTHSVEQCLEILKKNLETLQKRKRHLERIEDLMTSTIEETKKTLQVEVNQYEIIDLEDEHYFIYNMPYRTEEAVFDLRDARKLIAYCKSHFYNGTLNVSGIVLQKDIENGTFYKTYGAFRVRDWKSDKKEIGKNDFLRPKGTYVAVTQYTDGENFPEIYHGLCQFAKSQGYHICGNGYEEDLLSHIMEHNRSNYLVRCYVQIQKKVF